MIYWRLKCTFSHLLIPFWEHMLARENLYLRNLYYNQTNYVTYKVVNAAFLICYQCINYREFQTNWLVFAYKEWQSSCSMKTSVTSSQGWCMEFPETGAKVPDRVAKLGEGVIN